MKCRERFLKTCPRAVNETEKTGLAEDSLNGNNADRTREHRA